MRSREALIRKAMRLVPRDAGLHSLLGIALKRRGRGAAALDAYQRGLLLAPAESGCLHNLANLHRDSRRPDESVLWFRRGLRGKARDFNWHNAIGLWTAPILIVLTLTAVPISYRWGANLIYTIAGETPPAPQQGPGAAPAAPAFDLKRPSPDARPLSQDALIAIAQVLVMYVVVHFGVGLVPVYVFGTIAFLGLVGLTYMALIQAFNAIFGPAVGRVVTLAFLMLQLVSAGGIYPVETTAKPFQILHPFDPMTYAVNGLRQLTVGGIDSRLWISIAVLLGLLLASLGASALAVRRDRAWTLMRLHPPIEV